MALSIVPQRPTEFVGVIKNIPTGRSMPPEANLGDVNLVINYMAYAEQYLTSRQIDAVDIRQYIVLADPCRYL